MIRNILLSFALGASLWAQPAPAPPKPPADPPQPVVKHQEITLNGKTLKYTSTTGLMPDQTWPARLKPTSSTWRTRWMACPTPRLPPDVLVQRWTWLGFRLAAHGRSRPRSASA
ncbi:MAG: hypothetical protein QM757_21940 [Paludibaculum sp.]